VIPDGLGNAGTYRGREGFVRMIDGWHEAWEDFRIEIEDLVEEGDTVIVGITQHGRGRGSGIEVEMPGAHLMRFRDDRLHFWRLCGSREEALREAGGH
jgi:ketosteroid isomerase-like protein